MGCSQDRVLNYEIDMRHSILKHSVHYSALHSAHVFLRILIRD